MFHTLRNKILPLAFAGLVLSVTQARAATVETALSADHAYVGMPISLYVRISDATSHAQPVIPEVRGLQITASGVPSRSSQTTIINGRRMDRTSVTYAWNVTPREPGQFVIPPVQFEVDGQVKQTRALRFAATKSETGDLLFVEVDGKQEKIFVGQPLDLVLRVLVKPYRDRQFDVTLSPGDMWKLIATEHSQWGAFGETLDELAENRQRVNGQQVLHTDAEGEDQLYYAYEIPATIYPTRPGEVDTGDVQVVMRYPTVLEQDRSFFSSGGLTIAQARPLVENAKIPSTRVVPVPEQGRPADYRGAVGRYEMITRAQPQSVKAGDPITLNIGIRGDGPMELVQAPPLAALPSLTEAFKVPDESLAGLVEDDVKVFSMDIRPRRAGITEIPALPFSFFDPQIEKFETVWSDPIAIEVEAADQLALSSVVASSASQAKITPQGKSVAPGTQIALNHHRGPQLLDDTNHAFGWAVFFGLIWAPILFLIIAIVQFGPRILDRCYGGRRSAYKRASHDLAHAGDAEEVSSVLLTYIAALADISSNSLTRREAVALLQDTIPEQEVKEFDQLLASCEVSCYAGVSDADVQTLIVTAHQQLKNISRRHIRPANTHRTKRWLRTALLLVACSLFAGLFGNAGASLFAAELNRDQLNQILDEASAAYQQGLTATSDAAVAKEAYAQSASKYQLLVDQGVRNGKLYSNLATAYLQSGQAALALANYERALTHFPSDADARAGRDRALFLLTGEEQIQKQSIFEWFQYWNAKVSQHTRLWIGIFFWSVFWVALAAVILLEIRVGRKVAGVAAFICLLCGVSLGFQYWCIDSTDRGVVVVEDVQLREGNGAAFASLGGASLPEGSRFELVQRKGDWIEIRTNNGREGWMAADAAEMISPSSPHAT